MKRTRELELIDRKILTILQRDASVSHAELAERVGASSASCWRRIKALEADGVLLAAVRLADAHKLDRGVNVLCNVRVANQVQASSVAFEAFVREHPEIVECYSMSGDWDYLLRVVVRDVADYNAFLTGKMLKHPAVASASSNFALETIKFTTAVPL
ncbi:MAG: Lrp/AsnC family transcriptional regulator [Candidatus Andeanibacterium colombiense]|uniref:Lrp/AsnC family transcriptional regulator n=1 Tax=Candidatus Andeanibacterium colombiense TaxID=3121345 RepID=A0AAJ5XAP0_9SPHN|nr:MAG: Lrp/AsnC family transcriptional regulator [Sphingomonadaceae bacterium]